VFDDKTLPKGGVFFACYFFTVIFLVAKWLLSGANFMG